MKYPSGQLEVREADKPAWYRHWVDEGLQAVYAHCMTQQAFIDAAPQNQPDYVA